MRGIAWTNFIQAIIMLAGMFSAGILVSHALFGGVGPAFRTLAEIKPAHLVLPDTSGNGIFWYASTALLSALGFWMWPNIFMATYSARSERIVRLNSTVLPLYQFAMLPVVIVGFSCAAKAGLDPDFARDIEQPDQVMLVALIKTMPSWIVGLIGAGGLAASISTSSALILAAANLTSRNILQKRLMPDMTDMAVARTARSLVPVFTSLAVGLAFLAPNMLVNLLIIGYSGITQFFPGVVLGLFSRKPTSHGVITGLLTGLAIILGFYVSGARLPLGLQPGFIALVGNFLVVLTVSRLTKPVEAERLDRFERCLAAQNP